MGIPVVDLYALTTDPKHFVDGLHLSRSGNAVLYRALLQTIQDNWEHLVAEYLPSDAPMGWDKVKETDFPL